MPHSRLMVVLLAALMPAGCSGTAPPPAPPAVNTNPPAKVKTAAAAVPAENPPGEASTDTLVQQAVSAYKGGDLEKAIGRLDEALAREPTHRQALFLMAALAQERAGELDRPANSPYFLKSAQAIGKLHETYKDLNAQEHEMLAPALYNAACTYAIQNQPEKALDALAASIDAGLNAAELLAEDAELASIRSTPRFAELTSKIGKNALEQADSKAKKLLAEARPFPFRFELPDLTGKKVTLDDIAGKLVIVDVWGTWCPPCRKEIPHFKALLEKYRDRGLAMVGINYERVPDDQVKTTIAVFLKQHGVPYTCLIGDDRTREQVPDFEGYPTTLFLDRSGTARVKLVGYHSLVDLDAIITHLLRQDEKVSLP